MSTSGTPTKLSPPETKRLRFSSGGSDWDDTSLSRVRSPSSSDGDRTEIQVKTFTKWINSTLRRSSSESATVDNIYTDFKDGRRLLELTEALTGEKLPREKGNLRPHQIANLNRALDFLRNKRNVRLVNIDANDLANGNQKLTLGLIWTLILHFHIDFDSDAPSDAGQSTSKPSDAKSALLQWCQNMTGSYEGVEIKNFSRSWSDGRAFCAVIHKFRPDLIDSSYLQSSTYPRNKDEVTAVLRHAFMVAERELGVERLLEAEDVNTASPDDRSIMLYVASLKRALSNLSPKQQRQSGANDDAGEVFVQQKRSVRKLVLHSRCIQLSQTLDFYKRPFPQGRHVVCQNTFTGIKRKMATIRCIGEGGGGGHRC